MTTKAPAFFKVFIAESTSIDMMIPIAFTRRMDQVFPEKVMLRDRHDNIWAVKAIKVGDYWYFVDGWDIFVKDYLLINGDIMVFERVCDYLFNVKVYGPFATEKSAVFNFNRVEKPQEPTEYDDIGYANDHDEEETVSDRDYNFARRDHNNKHDQDDGDEETEDADSMQMRRRQNEHQEVVKENVNNNNGAGSSRNTKQRLTYLYPRCYGMEIFEAGLAEQPRNPYFVTKIMPKRKSDLFIPMDVIKDYKLDIRHEIILVDPTGREFRTKCRQWKDRRFLLSGGWRRLCRVNFVTPEHSCICEFMPRKGDEKQFLRVSFVRANLMENQD